MEKEKQSIEDIARARGVSEVALEAWRALSRQCTHDFLPWEFDNVTGEIHRGPGVTGSTPRPILDRSWSPNFKKKRSRCGPR